MTAEVISNYNKYLEDKRKEFQSDYKKPSQSQVGNSDFERLRTLGKGAFGRVLLVRHKQSNTFYALKILSKEEIIKGRQVENAISEKQLLAALKSPFIISLAYSYKDNSYLYMILEFVIGGEMFTLLRNMRKFPDSFVKFYGAQTILAFEYMHYVNVAYRDLKPENILINSDGYLKVADLGFAKVIPRDKRTWTLCGTPDYMAPEIILNRGYSFPVDWWAFGVLLYEMTAGFPPFMHQDQMRTFEQILNGKVRFTSSFSSNLKDLVKNLLQLDLSRRYGNLKGGIDDIKNHRYFQDVNFLALVNRQLKPPYKPKVKGPGDSSAFEKWEEEHFKIADKDKYSKDFHDF